MTHTTEHLEQMLAAATPGPWSGHNMVHADHGGPMTPDEIGEYVSNSVKVGSPDRFLFVSGKHDDGGYADICHTGNGPRGPHNTALIAAAPAITAELIAARRMIEAAQGLVDAVQSLGAMPEGYCFCSSSRIGDDSKTHEPECADIRAALATWGTTK